MTPATTLQPSVDLAGHDARGIALTGATPRAIAYFEQALAAHLSWRGGAEEPLSRALHEAPGFVMAHAMQAWLFACSRDIHRVRQARAPLQRALAAGPQREGERLHLAALAALLDDDYPRAKQLLGQLLQRSPHDVLALQAAHALDYLTGDLDQLVARAARVLPAWNSALPGREAVQAMHAFGLVEGGDGEAAEREARAVLAQNPLDVRAHHVMAHVFETTGRAAEGVRWMDRHADAWATSRMVATHCAWHLALFHLALGDVEHALAVHDRHILATQTGDIADLIDASALLWRVQLQGGDVGARWQALAEAWAARADDGFCSFSDVHAMLAFVGAGDERRARGLVDSLVAIRSRPTRYGQTTRQLGLPACQGLVASGQGQYPLAITHLSSLPAAAHRLGGSHAQRDVLYLTLAQAVERVRRPTSRKLARPASSLAPRVETVAR